MAKKTTRPGKPGHGSKPFITAFASIFNHFGGDMSKILKYLDDSEKEPRILTKENKIALSPPIQLGTKWKDRRGGKEILLKVDDIELATFNGHQGINKQYYNKPFVDNKNYSDSYFFLFTEISTGSHFEIMKAMFNLFERIASDEGLSTFFAPADKAAISASISGTTSDDDSTPIEDDSSDEKDLKDSKEMPLNLILYGPPGTGKTYNTIYKTLDVLGVPAEDAPGHHSTETTWFDKEYPNRDKALEEFKKMKEDGRIVFTTFHQSMSYEDFIEGIKPDLKGMGKTLGYTIEPGLFKRISEEAAKHENEQKEYVLIIDEINRGNIANIFGELITLIEDDKRTTKWDKTMVPKGAYVKNPEAIKVKLPYSKKEEFGVPGNLYIIGTMNTADRSVEALDSALRRRFSFKEMLPRPELLESVTIDGLGMDKTLKDLLSTINERIEVLKDREHQIGHSYFMKFVDETGKKKTVSPDDLKSVFTDKIIPLLQEYFYGDYEKIQLVIGDVFVTSKETSKVNFVGGVSYEDNLPEKIYSIEKNPDMANALNKLLNIK